MDSRASALVPRNGNPRRKGASEVLQSAPRARRVMIGDLRNLTGWLGSSATGSPYATWAVSDLAILNEVMQCCFIQCVMKAKTRSR